jgi:hypothetical protein
VPVEDAVFREERWPAHRAAYEDDVVTLRRLMEQADEEQRVVFDACGNTVSAPALTASLARCLMLQHPEASDSRC